MGENYRDERGIREMIMDELACNKIDSWGEWNFLAKGVPVERQGYEDLEYDLLVVDLENRRIQADTVGYSTWVQGLVGEAVENLENEYGYLTSSVSTKMAQEEGFEPARLGEEGNPQVFWSEDEEWMLRTSEFESVSQELFGYDILSQGYDRIDQELC